MADFEKSVSFVTGVLHSMARTFIFLMSAVAWTGLMCAEVPSAVAIKDARVVTVSGADLPKATVLLRNGLIEDVGPNLTIPADAWVIDGSSLIVYPGFIDGLSTWGIPELAPPAPAASRTAPSTVAPTPTPAPQGPRSHGP